MSAFLAVGVPHVRAADEVEVTKSGDYDPTDSSNDESTISGTLRYVLTQTTYSYPTIVNLLTDSPITITYGAIGGTANVSIGNNITELKGKAGYLDTLAIGLIDNANSFINSILTNPDPSTWTWGTYFDPKGAFESKVKSAIDSALSGASVIKMGEVTGGYRENSVISDARSSGLGLAYTNVAFKDFITTTSSNIGGGGVVSASTTTGSVAIGDISNSLFTENTVKAAILSGGGVVGASSGINATVILGTISGSLFSGNTVMVNGTYLRGGGVVGAVSITSPATLGAISNSLFTGNIVEASSNGGLQGGGVVGAYSSTAPSSIGAISNSLFIGNEINVTSASTSAKLYGGLIYTGDDLTITNSSFVGNNFTMGTLANFLGTVSINMGRKGNTTSQSSDETAIHTVTLEAEDGQTTRFENNVASRLDENGSVIESKSNSIAFKNIQSSNPTATAAVLKIVTQGTGKVELLDPIWVDLSGTQTFTMTVSGDGEFWWGGTNTVTSGTSDNNKITLGSGTDKLTTKLQPDFALNAPGHKVVVDSGTTLDFADKSHMTVNALTINSGGTLNAAQGSTSVIDATNALTINDGGTLGLTLDSAYSDIAIIKAGSAEINDGAMLDIVGYSEKPGSSYPSPPPKSYTLIHTTSGIKNSGAITVAGQPISDTWDEHSFMTATLQYDDDDDPKILNVTAGLIWGEAKNAHGTFEVADTFTFTLGAVLEDKLEYGPSSGSNNKFHWDGKTLTKTGDGTLTLTGANTYSGGSVVEAGTLAGNISSGDLTIHENAIYDGLKMSRTLAALNDGPDNKGGTLKNTDGLTITGGGTFHGSIDETNTGGLTVNITSGENQTQTLAGTNTYPGNTMIRAGTLKITGSLGTSDEATEAYTYTYDIANADTLILDQSIHQTIAGTISGNGSLTKTGEGTLTLAGANTYGGGTVVGDGKVIVGNDSALGSGTVVMQSGTTLGFAGDYTLNNDFTLSGQATFDTDTHNATLAGNISGDGSLTKVGTGELILEASNNSVGEVNVNGGSLIVGESDGSSVKLTATSGVTVNPGALLGGHGTIDGNVFIHAGGTLSPGHSIGTLDITNATPSGNNLIFESGAYYDVEIDPASTSENLKGDLVTVTGTAKLAGIVRPRKSEDSKANSKTQYLDKEWLILAANTFKNGTEDTRFDKTEAISGLAFLKPELNYDKPCPDGSSSAACLYLSFSSILFNDPTFPWSEHPVAGALESLAPGSSLYEDILNNVPYDQVSSLLNELSGEAHASLKGHLFMQDTDFLRRLARHVGVRSALRGGDMDDPRARVGDNLWISVNRNHSVLDGDRNAGRSTLTGTEIAGGHDADFDDGWRGGIAFRLHDGRHEVDSRRSEADLMSYAAALYGAREMPVGNGTLRFLLSTALTRHDIESTRRILIGTRDQKVKANYSGTSWQGAFETAYRLPATERLFVEPYASVALHSLRLDGFEEKGGNAALRKRAETWNHPVSLLGLRMMTPLIGRITLDTDLAWKHVYGSTVPKSVFAFKEGSDRFAIVGPGMNRNAAIVGLGVGINLTNTAQLHFNYDGELGNQGQNHTGRIILEVKF